MDIISIIALIITILYAGICVIGAWFINNRSFTIGLCIGFLLFGWITYFIMKLIITIIYNITIAVGLLDFFKWLFGHFSG